MDTLSSPDQGGVRRARDTIRLIGFPQKSRDRCGTDGKSKQAQWFPGHRRET
jgi:hypothetical protein